jgi:predicted Zn-dependent peptidase
MDYQIFTLRNGIRIIHKQDKSPVAYCGLIINTGSRDEKEESMGWLTL